MQTALLLEIDRPENGYSHLSARMVAWGDDGQKHWHICFDSKLKPSRYSCDGDSVEVGAYAQLGRGTYRYGLSDTSEAFTREPYALTHGVKPYRDRYLTDTQAQNVAKASRLLRSRLNRIEHQMGYPQKFVDVCIHLAVAMRCEFVTRSLHCTYDGQVFDHLTAGSARYWLELRIAEFNDKYNPLPKVESEAA